jgi:hypothetical protein
VHGDAGDRVGHFWHEIESNVRSARSLEAVAHLFVRNFYETFADISVLVRLFATVAAARLEPGERQYLVEQGWSCEDATPVLTLLGTRGVAPAWNDRRTSRNHRAIPLLSHAFIEDAPMIARLFAELGVSPLADTSAGADWQYLRKLGGGDGLFFVGDARTSTDSRGRPIIPSTEFIEDFGIKTVFGFGGPYPSAHTSVAVVVFCRRTITREDALAFVRLSNMLRDAYADSPGRATLFLSNETA